MIFTRVGPTVSTERPIDPRFSRPRKTRVNSREREREIKEGGEKKGVGRERERGERR